MKKHLAFLLMITLAACSKNDSERVPCYDCKVYIMTQAGLTPVNMERCTNKIDTMHFEDQFGNDLMFDACTLKQ